MTPAYPYSYFSAEPELWAAENPLLVDGGALQFGFESEFTEIPALLAFYGVLPELGLGDDPAAALPAYCRSLPHGEHPPVMGKIDGPDFLPATLHRDDTGNVELVLEPTSRLRRFAERTDWVNRHFGVGSLQAMVSLPREAFFRAGGPREHLGWLNFFNELDVLSRLNTGYLRGGEEPARNFLHPYLGPMIALRHRLLAKFLRENAEGRLLEAEDLIRPARRDQSFKFVGSTAYRPDVAGPERLCFEVRDAHRDPELLRERVARVVYYWRRGLAHFAPFAEVAPFDSAAAFAALPSATAAWIERAVPARIPEAVRPFEKPRFTYETFRNFAYPFRDWTPWFSHLPHADAGRVARAQAAYLARLADATPLAGASARGALQRALVRFPEESGLLAAFREEELRLVEAARG